ncbi:MAG: hypothetical protein U1E73_11825 [Planctomycetota bacterium]
MRFTSWSDDFNQPNTTNMGPFWTEVVGDEIIQNNQGQGNLATGWSYMLHNFAAMSPATTRMEIDLMPPLGTSGPHVALITGAASGATQWFHTKIQDNDSNGTYDRIFFYSNGNGGGWGSPGSRALTTPVTTGRVYMYFTNAGDTLNVDIDENFDGVIDQHYANSGALAVTVAGTGFGIGTWAMGAYDNWRIADCLPATAQTYGTGFPGTLGVPAIAASATPVLGTSITIDIANSLGAVTAGAVVIGFSSSQQPMPWGGTLLASPDAVLFTVLPAAGYSLPFAIPPGSYLCGVGLYCQGGIIDAGAAQGIANTAGLALVLGG